MRIGAIFARGSCRALKWMALAGVVFALGAGSAAAQITVKAPKTVDEAGRLTITVTAKVELDADGAATTVTVTPTVEPGTADLPNLLTAAENEAGDRDYDEAEALTLNVPRNSSNENVAKHTLTGTITVQTRPDLDAEDEAITVSFAATGGNGVNNQGGADLTDTPGSVNVTINDTDDQTFEWEVTTATPKESGTIAVTLTPDPDPVDLTYSTALSVDKTGYTVDPASIDFAAGALEYSGTITPPNPDGDRDDDLIMLSAFVAGTTTSRVDPLEIEVEDIHGLPAADKITTMAYMSDEGGKKTEDEAMSVMEGADHPVYVTVTVDRGTSGYPSDEKLNVAVTADGSQALDYRVDPAMVEIASGAGKKTADFKLWALADDDVGMEDLMLTLTAKGAMEKDNGPGERMAMFSIMIADATEPMVSVKDGAYDAIMMALGDDPLNPGDSVEIMTDDLFMYDSGMVSVSFAASVEGAAVNGSASGDTVMLMALAAGEAKVTVTATATAKSSSLIITQTVANVAQVTFPVMVELADLMVTLSGPEDMNIAEGMSAMVTAMANRAVTEDTMVELIQTEGTASPADFMAEPIMIMAGEMMGTTMVMAVEDEMMEDMEMLTLEGRVGDMKTNSVMFYLWDAAVPALPLVAQLLLGLFLALGGYRRYLRR